jgi:hypothetical protein
MISPKTPSAGTQPLVIKLLLSSFGRVEGEGSLGSPVVEVVGVIHVSSAFPDINLHFLVHCDGAFHQISLKLATDEFSDFIDSRVSSVPIHSLANYFVYLVSQVRYLISTVCRVFPTVQYNMYYRTVSISFLYTTTDYAGA